MAELAADPLGANAQLGAYTNFVNLLGWCALALPFGFTESGLPFGVTFIAPAQLRRRAGALRASAGKPRLDLPLGATGRSHEHRLQADAARPPPRRTLRAGRGRRPPERPAAQRPADRARRARCARPPPPPRITACSRCPAPCRPSPGCCACARAARPSRSRCGRCRWTHVGSFLALIPAPLGLGSLTLADGSSVHGFVCEAQALRRRARHHLVRRLAGLPRIAAAR